MSPDSTDLLKSWAEAILTTDDRDERERTEQEGSDLHFIGGQASGD
jgi:hypothetical protein